VRSDSVEGQVPFKVSEVSPPYLENGQKVINSQWFQPEKYLQELEATITKILEKKATGKTASFDIY